VFDSHIEQSSAPKFDKAIDDFGVSKSDREETVGDKFLDLFYGDTSELGSSQLRVQ
jgi:hypothetical protein